MKGLFLLIVVLVLLIFIFAVNNRPFEPFKDLRNLREDIPEPKSAPLLYNADNRRQLFELQRIYPHRGTNDYSPGDYANINLPPDVIGCGGRRQPCYGGTQQNIGNILPPLDISNKNIAPRNGYIGPYPPYQQVGYLYKIMAPYEDNDYRPLYLEKVDEKDRNLKYRYFTLNMEGDRKEVETPSVYRELGTNDQVKIQGEDYFFRVTVNDSNFPSYPRIS